MSEPNLNTEQPCEQCGRLYDEIGRLRTRLAAAKSREAKAACTRCGCSMGVVGDVDWAHENTVLRTRLAEAEALCSFLASAWFYGNWRPESYVERQQQACMERLGWWPIADEDDLLKRVAPFRDNGSAADMEQQP